MLLHTAGPEQGYMRKQVESRVLGPCKQSGEGRHQIRIHEFSSRSLQQKSWLAARQAHPLQRTTDSNSFSCLDKGLRYATWLPGPNASQ
ncbi:hypothetical protein NQZ68_015636 [Dissostichus eleginoides]|uniref:Uncharacterized protein n=2 Tax=Champsocephalus TaxID=52236 RepID=A0AAN8D5D0_CHAGU|nr:hypothetical protein NQZ68_015636 [Dissostichus eleginoides]KAK5885780.1 hypothetical protein CesoFtcFv8_016882 [Champsocephalus esox]KAK5916272.1 hypothetical protein CgunFtcFv8_011273 [Champsocephalus gunnari]